MIEDIVKLAEAAAAAASEKKARDILLLDMNGISSVTDYFMICSANSTKQVQAIADNIEEKLAEQGEKPLHTEGYRDGRWVLLDYGCLVVHCFIEDERIFYNLERLWGDAAVRPWKD